MKRTLQTVAFAAAVLVASVVPAVGAGASTPRADAHYEIWCTTADGDVYLAKRVNVRAIQPEKEPGGKDTATERFNANNPFGEHCVEVGPIG